MVSYFEQIGSYFERSENFSLGLWKLHSTCSEEHFRGKNGKLQKSLSVVLTVDRKNLPIWAKKFQQGYKNWIVGVGRNFFGFETNR